MAAPNPGAHRQATGGVVFGADSLRHAGCHPLTSMVCARFDSEPGRSPGHADRPAGRLSLLLAGADWQHEPWIDRVGPLLAPLGVQALRAGSGLEARRLIQTEPVHIAVVDLALPLERDSSRREGGQRVLEILCRLVPPVPTVVVQRSATHRDESRQINAALRTGAFAVIERPRDTTGLELLLEVLRRCLKRHYQDRWPLAGEV